MKLPFSSDGFDSNFERLDQITRETKTSEDTIERLTYDGERYSSTQGFNPKRKRKTVMQKFLPSIFTSVPVVDSDEEKASINTLTQDKSRQKPIEGVLQFSIDKVL